MNCRTMVNSTIGVEANVKVNAKVKVGEVDTHCVGRPFIRRCYNQDNKCVYMVFQRMNVRFPLIYSTNVTARSTGVTCEPINNDGISNHNYQDNRECCQDASECCQETSDCCQVASVCNQEPIDCCEDASICSQEPINCCEDTSIYRRDASICSQELKDYCQETSINSGDARISSQDTKKRKQKPWIGRQQLSVQRNKLNSPFIELATLLRKGIRSFIKI